MTDNSAAIRAYIREVSSAVPEFDGQKIHLQRFIMAIKLVDLAKASHCSPSYKIKIDWHYSEPGTERIYN